MPFHRLHYHLIWATYRRESFITPEIERQLYGAILQKAKDLGCKVHAIGGIDNHIHLAATIPPRIAVAEVTRQFKGASSYYVNHQTDTRLTFRWQRGYGALTFGDRSMETVIAYVRNQKEHHRQQTTIAVFERVDSDD